LYPALLHIKKTSNFVDSESCGITKEDISNPPDTLGYDYSVWVGRIATLICCVNKAPGKENGTICYIKIAQRTFLYLGESVNLYHGCRYLKMYGVSA